MRTVARLAGLSVITDVSQAKCASAT